MARAFPPDWRNMIFKTNRLSSLKPASPRYYHDVITEIIISACGTYITIKTTFLYLCNFLPTETTTHIDKLHEILYHPSIVNARKVLDHSENYSYHAFLKMLVFIMNVDINNAYYKTIPNKDERYMVKTD